MKSDRVPTSFAGSFARLALLAACTQGLVAQRSAIAQTTAPTPPPRVPIETAQGELKGRTVEQVRIVGNTQVSTSAILNRVRTREGEPFDPETVASDYQNIYALKTFANVEAKVEPTATGVIVIFTVTEQRQIKGVRIIGNLKVDDQTIRNAIDVRTGESVDRFRLSIARQAIEQLYRDKNFPYAQAMVDQDILARTGEVVFNITEGPNVRIRNIDFIGANSYSEDRLKGEIQSKTWIWIFRSGQYDPNRVDDDVAALRRFYESKGFFDARVGRKLIFSPDQSELQINYVIEEGVRYKIDRVTFKGVTSVGEADLRKNLKLTEGSYWDQEILQRDVRQVIRDYSPFGFIYQPQSQDPDYLRVEPKPVFRREAGTVELVYDVREGKPFRMGNIIIKGNARTQDKVVLREMRVAPGQVYNAGELLDAGERLRGTPYFAGGVTITPIGDDPITRDVLVEVKEGNTASAGVGAGINSNGGIGGNITYQQRNFDITNWPGSWSDIFSDRSFTGAGQTFRASLEPGTVNTNASIRFVEPYIFDQPYAFSSDIYLRNRRREDYVDRRIGARFGLTKRFDYVYSAQVFARGEDVNIRDIRDKEIRSLEIVDAEGHATLTSLGLQLRRDTTNRGLLPSNGTTTTLGYEQFGALGGDYSFARLTGAVDAYFTLGEDLLDRKTILSLHGDIGYVTEDAPFFERFYAGGLGSVRGFAFRGISPRDGPDEDRIGGDFSITGSAEISYPLVGDALRGVVFVDAGTVERDVSIGTIRSSVGTGIRWTLPIFGQIPIAIDLALPITKDDDDDTRIISFSLGIQQ